MSEPINLSTRAFIKVAPEILWAFLADTERLNRAVGLPAVQFIPFPDPAQKGHYQAETKVFGMTMAYEEFPFDWVEGRYYKVLRKFSTGPIAEAVGGIRVAPAEGGTNLEMFARVTPRNFIGKIVARQVIGKKTAREMMDFVQAFERHFAKPREEPPPWLPPAGDLHVEVLDSRLAGMAGTAKLRRHLLEASDLDVVRMRPFEVAERWGEDRTAVLRLFLQAARKGVLDLVWNVLCPSCRMPTQQLVTLAAMKSQSHCETCKIGFGADFAASVEARFTVNPAVRTARQETYCIGGPANTPGIHAQLRLEPGEERVEELDLKPGDNRIRCYQAAGIVPLEVAAGGRESAEVRCEEGGLKVEGARVKPGVVRLKVKNALSREALVVVERETFKANAATAAMVTSLQDFRDLFPNEAVAPGEEVGIASLAVLFTDLKSSTELYQRVGDTKAFAFVQNHFRYLVEAVAKYRGGLVKTMGDAVMATFASARDAIESAVEMQQNWSDFRRERGDYKEVSLKIGIHQGSSIAINNAGKLDYFGTTVNMAARVQAQSLGDDVVFSQALMEDPEVQGWLEFAGMKPESFQAVLKGIEGNHVLHRVRLSR